MNHDRTHKTIPLPEYWPGSVRSVMLQVVSLAHWAIAYSRSWAADSKLQRVRLAGELERARNEISLLREEMRIKDARMLKIPAQQRPHYPPVERMAILQLRAAGAWNLAQTAKAFLVEPETIASWMKRIDEDGEQALVQLAEPINKFPEFVLHIVTQLKILCPTMGKRRIADMLARAGLTLSATTVARFREAPSWDEPEPYPTGDHSEVLTRIVTARHPNHVWHVDLTAVPTGRGFWTAWFPETLPQVWPFCYWVALVMDHFSRKLIGFAVFRQPPSSIEVQAFLDSAVLKTGKAPRHMICDKGTQFWCVGFKTWCEQRHIRPRYGAVGRYGSIAVIERFIRSMKTECTRRILVPLDQAAFRRELGLYATWYNQCRPHQWLDARTPQDVYGGASSASPISFRSGEKGPKLTLHLSYLEGRKHLPVVELRPAA